MTSRLIAAGALIMAVIASTSGSWVRVRRARLVRVRGLYGSLSTTFTIRTRRLTMRAVVAANTTGPCYLETVSKQWRT